MKGVVDVSQGQAPGMGLAVHFRIFMEKTIQDAFCTAIVQILCSYGRLCVQNLQNIRERSEEYFASGLAGKSEIKETESLQLNAG